ncbi:GntR family transcriptional regulator [Bradyrhizobium sp. SZCCHNRI2007]|uniref:GntR family transcriptional regulator n=1 Tax=Bradyrhizobium sp. SZCCHNRI2007 TaxID=3057281 RepID=UPI0028E5BD37|nr:GntR family transcriptional regulator [Bradyrhizobium sp. SZCCHNRI2007]
MSSLPLDQEASRTSVSSTADLVVNGLRKAILHNELRGGERLRQDAIANQYGVSQMIVREAFKQLAAEGFLKAEPRRGVSVALLSADEAWEVTQLRAILECQALQWAIPNMLRSDFLQCTRILDELDRSDTVDAKIVLNAQFHTSLYAPSRRERTLDLIENLRMNFERYLRYTWEETHHLEQSQAEHRTILNLCEMRDVERASDALRKHILATGDLLVDSLRHLVR